MELNYDDFNHDPHIRTDLHSQINGLDAFRKVLERDFFSSVKISTTGSTEDGASVNLIIEMSCNLGLIEALSHYRKENWGTTYEKQGQAPTLTNSFRHLQDQNTLDVDIEELTLFLKDTSIVINVTTFTSIPMYWDTIISEMGNHFVHFTKGLSEMPTEIYLPVFYGYYN